MSGEQFYINYSLNGEHYAMGPYHTRRFAMSHIDDVRLLSVVVAHDKACV